VDTNSDDDNGLRKSTFGASPACDKDFLRGPARNTILCLTAYSVSN